MVTKKNKSQNGRTLPDLIAEQPKRLISIGIVITLIIIGTVWFFTGNGYSVKTPIGSIEKEESAPKGDTSQSIVIDHNNGNIAIGAHDINQTTSNK